MTTDNEDMPIVEFDAALRAHTADAESRRVRTHLGIPVGLTIAIWVGSMYMFWSASPAARALLSRADVFTVRLLYGFATITGLLVALACVCALIVGATLLLRQLGNPYSRSAALFLYIPFLGSVVLSDVALEVGGLIARSLQHGATKQQAMQQASQPFAGGIRSAIERAHRRAAQSVTGEEDGLVWRFMRAIGKRCNWRLIRVAEKSYSLPHLIEDLLYLRSMDGSFRNRSLLGDTLAAGLSTLVSFALIAGMSKCMVDLATFLAHHQR